MALGPGAVLLGVFATAMEAELLAGLDGVLGSSPFRHMVTPGGFPMSVAMSHCGIGTHTGPAFSDFTIEPFPAASGRTVRLSGTTAVRVENGKIAEEAIWMAARCRHDEPRSADV